MNLPVAGEPSRLPSVQTIMSKILAKYGLDEANRITVTATYKDSTSGDKKTCTVYIGNENGDNRYVQLKDSNMVYEVGSSIVENMMSVDK